MRPFPIPAVVMAAILVGTIVDPEHWFGGNVTLVVIADLAVALVAFNWWELWSARHQR